MNELIKKINSISKDYDVYAVGGFARDLLLKLKHKDIDLAVNNDALKYAKKVAAALKAKLITLDEDTETYRIILKDCKISNIDIALFNGKTIEEDLQNRDFTINAIAFKLKYFENFRKHIIFSNKNTLVDLKSKTFNVMSEKTFKADPLRMLRAFRFISEFTGFKLSNKTLLKIKQNAKLIKSAAPERIKNEFFRILSAQNSSELLKTMDDCGLLSGIFPEIEKMKKAKKKYYYHPGGLFEHSFETLESAENILINLKKYFPESFIELQEHFYSGESLSENVTRVSLLKFTALFHDNAKPETAKFANGKMRFFEHEDFGANKLREIMHSLKFGKRDIETATFLVRHHMRPSILTRNNIVTKKAALKFFRDIGDNSPDLIVLSMADWHSYKRLKVFSPKELKLQEKSARELIKKYYELKNTKPLPKVIDGNIIMREFRLKPGPWVGELLNFVNEAQFDGKVLSKNDALKLILSKLTHIKKKYRI
ncbi:HD domain-containing protein [Candidatus Endomicrobiellum devescovinae]|jgi:poly(A) polymerase|uniref:HD domain-containing protein n=1 Tax=Candidatus Endomicrobiellum devescovinae TaxID=3242322 RepID=UPI00281DA1D1|nr:HD domain-containing protein [Endomicrobium sp.]